MPIDTCAQLREESENLHHQVAEMDGVIATYNENKAKLMRVATFPEQNPNVVIETNLMAKLDVRNVVELLRVALRHHLIVFDDNAPDLIGRMMPVARVSARAFSVNIIRNSVL
jgi:hypothetical protein